jgi:aspartyl-tRNA(Asn)/glutamyl-tRNA(Gln) amidotransferase subunit B
LGTRAEIKNVNSFRFVERAINYEVARQIEVIENGGSVVQETRLYDSDKNETRSLRDKESAQDYRYFADPDLMPVYLEPTLLEQVRKELPELPWQKQERFMREFDLSAYDASVMVSSRALSSFFEETVSHTQAPAKQVANWIMGDFLAALNRHTLDINAAPVSAKQLAELLNRIHDNTISGKIAKTVFEAMWNGEGDADAIIAAQGLKQVTDSGAIEQMIDDVIAAHPQHVAEYRAGKEKLFGFFVGEIMKRSKGKANPQQVNDLLKQKLSAP